MINRFFNEDYEEDLDSETFTDDAPDEDIDLDDEVDEELQEAFFLEDEILDAQTEDLPESEPTVNPAEAGDPDMVNDNFEGENPEEDATEASDEFMDQDETVTTVAAEFGLNW